MATKYRKTTAIALTGAVFALGLTACSDDKDSDDTVTVTQQAPASSSSAAPASLSAGNTTGAQGGNGMASGDKDLKISLGGQDANTQAFQPASCGTDMDDGRQELNYRAGQEDSANELSVEIDPQGQRVTSLDLKVDGVEYKDDAAQLNLAKDGEKYTITGEVMKDNSAERTPLSITLSCAGA